MELRLLVEHTGGTPAIQRTLSAANRTWSITDPYDIANPNLIPEYTCISYVWGERRVPHPYIDTMQISDHTLPTLASAIKNDFGTAFWIDVFCLPTEKPMKQATLQSMGYIYSLAKSVVVVFSSASFAAIERVTGSDQLDDSCLDTLERDEWVTSVWTYQEVVNARQVFCVCEGLFGSRIDGMEFLNRVGFSLQQYRKRHGLDGFGLVKCFPHLSALEDLFADWLTAGYLERSALQVMANMDQRIAREPANHFYSMIGAVTQAPSDRAAHPTVNDLAELFMTICEAKNDYSFIYSAAPRDTVSGKHWRPTPGSLPAILPWHCAGAQHARCEVAGIWLDDMVALQPAHTLTDAGRDKIGGWLSRDLQSFSDARIAELLAGVLMSIGFQGSGTHVLVQGGLFFPMHAVPATATALIAIGIYWVFGAPGLMAWSTENGSMSYVPGVFVGSTAGQDVRSVLLA